MIKQILTVVALVGLMSGTAMAQSSGSAGGGAGSQNLKSAPATAGGVSNSNNSIGKSGADAGMYRDSKGKPCTAGTAGCMRDDKGMKHDNMKNNNSMKKQ